MSVSYGAGTLRKRLRSPARGSSRRLLSLASPRPPRDDVRIRNCRRSRPASGRRTLRTQRRRTRGQGLRGASRRGRSVSPAGRTRRSAGGFPRDDAAAQLQYRWGAEVLIHLSDVEADGLQPGDDGRPSGSRDGLRDRLRRPGSGTHDRAIQERGVRPVEQSVDAVDRTWRDGVHIVEPPPPAVAYFIQSRLGDVDGCRRPHGGDRQIALLDQRCRRIGYPRRMVSETVSEFGRRAIEYDHAVSSVQEGIGNGLARFTVPENADGFDICRTVYTDLERASPATPIAGTVGPT